jgi:hypothetical protein
LTIKAMKFGKPQSDVAIKPDPVNRYERAFRPLPGAPAPVALADVLPRHCVWPIGEDPILFCGCATETGRYCPAHEKMSGIRLAALV